MLIVLGEIKTDAGIFHSIAAKINILNIKQSFNNKKKDTRN